MLAFSKMKQSDLALIDEIRDQAKANSPRHGRLRRGTGKLSFAHEAFTLGLNHVKDAGLPSEASAVRVIETGGDAFSIIYDVYANAGAQMFGDKAFVNQYEKTFERLLALDDDHTNYLVRTVRVPALHLDAVWLHDASKKTNDKFIPIQNGITPADDRIYDRTEFFNLLQRLAEQLNVEDDESGG